MKGKLLIIILLVLLLGGAFVLAKNQLVRFFSNPRSVSIEGVEPSGESEALKTTIIAENLEITWEIAFLPNDEMLVTERPGRLLKINSQTRTVLEIQGVEHQGEGGLLGLAVHPDFEENHFIYLYLTFERNGGLENRVERYRLEEDKLSERKVILEGILGASFHDGGRMAFGPDGYLYITTGDASNSNLAQDTTSLNGKILRIGDDGKIPEDNPFGNAVYSFGHRNPQGLAWDEKGQLWATEHGPSGLQSGFDEVNLIEKGKNYGWPVIKGDQIREGMVTPVLQSGANDTWAPAGMVFFKGKLFFGGLRGEALFETEISDDNKLMELEANLKGDYGRIRAVVLGPDGFLYLSTSNTDGRGTLKAGDDKIIRVDPESFLPE